MSPSAARPAPCEVQPPESVDEFVIRTVAAICDLEISQVAPDTALSDLSMDSLRITAFAAHVQAEHGCEVTPGDVMDLLEAACVCDLAVIVNRMKEHQATRDPL